MLIEFSYVVLIRHSILRLADLKLKLDEYISFFIYTFLFREARRSNLTSKGSTTFSHPVAMSLQSIYQVQYCTHSMCLAWSLTLLRHLWGEVAEVAYMTGPVFLYHTYSYSFHACHLRYRSDNTGHCCGDGCDNFGPLFILVSPVISLTHT